GELRDSFSRQPDYWLRDDQPPGPASPNGFQQPGLEATKAGEQPPEQGAANTSHWQHFGLASVLPPADGLRTATDDWPFLYLRQPMIPTLSLRGMLIMGGLGLLLIFLFLHRTKTGAMPRVDSGVLANRLASTLNLQLFFLGAGFMLVETKAVVTMALLFGSTWVVNSVVFLAVLVMILFANLWTLRFNPARLWPYYAGLLITLALNAIVPLDFFLGMSRSIQVLGSCLLVFAPILFAGV